jgi:hypothetical protein
MVQAALFGSQDNMGTGSHRVLYVLQLPNSTVLNLKAPLPCASPQIRVVAKLAEQCDCGA